MKLVIVAAALAFSPVSATERASCVADAMEFCFGSAIRADRAAVAKCLIANKPKLHKACQAVLTRRGM